MKTFFVVLLAFLLFTSCTTDSVLMQTTEVVRFKEPKTFKKIADVYYISTDSIPLLLDYGTLVMPDLSTINDKVEISYIHLFTIVGQYESCFVGNINNKCTDDNKEEQVFFTFSLWVLTNNSGQMVLSRYDIVITESLKYKCQQLYSVPTNATYVVCFIPVGNYENDNILFCKNNSDSTIYQLNASNGQCVKKYNLPYTTLLTYKVDEEVRLFMVNSNSFNIIKRFQTTGLSSDLVVEKSFPLTEGGNYKLFTTKQDHYGIDKLVYISNDKYSYVYDVSNDKMNNLNMPLDDVSSSGMVIKSQKSYYMINIDKNKNVRLAKLDMTDDDNKCIFTGDNYNWGLRKFICYILKTEDDGFKLFTIVRNNESCNIYQTYTINDSFIFQIGWSFVTSNGQYKNVNFDINRWH